MRKIFAFLLLAFAFQWSTAQPCTRVNSLIINTGYNFATGTAYAPGQTDPNWQITAVSPNMALVPNVFTTGPVQVITRFGSWAASPGGVSEYVSCFTANFFPTPVENPTVMGSYAMSLTRTFTTCMSDSLVFNYNMAADNQVIGVTLDGTTVPFPPITTNNFSTFANVVFTRFVPAGVHQFTVVLDNIAQNVPIPQNFYGVNIYGTISSASGTNSIASMACNNVCPTNCSDTCYWRVTGNNIINGNNIFGTLTNDNIRVYSNSQSRGIITNTGRFGWQTASPTTLFHINCANPPQGISNLRFENLSTNLLGTPLVVDVNGYVYRGTNKGGGLTNTCGTTNYVTKTGSTLNTLECSQIYDDGTFVGIGTTFPLIVNGVTSLLNVNGLTVTNSLYVPSDRKYKKDIQPIKDAMSIIRKLNGVTYDWNRSAYPAKNFDAGKQAGFIAQEVENVFPIAVAKDKDNYVVNYNAFIPLLTKGQQELFDIITDLQQQVNDLKAQINNSPNAKTLVKADRSEIAQGNKLSQNRPNPFSHSTIIEYTVANVKTAGFVVVYDLSGKELLRFKTVNSGTGTITIDRSKLLNGMYLYSLVIDGQEVDTKKMVLMKD